MPDNVNCSVSTTGDFNPPVAGGSWMESVVNMGNWYMENVFTYHGACNNKCSKTIHSSYYDCPSVPNGSVRDDCSGYVYACLTLFNRNIYVSGLGTGSLARTYTSQDTEIAKKLAANGFTYIPFDYNKLQRGDIIASQKHVEIVDDHTKNRSYSWGNVRNGKSRGECCISGTAAQINGISCKIASNGYTAIWRYTG